MSRGKRQPKNPINASSNKHTKEVNGTAAAIPSTHKHTEKKTNKRMQERKRHPHNHKHTHDERIKKMHEHEKDETEKINIAS